MFLDLHYAQYMFLSWCSGNCTGGRLSCELLQYFDESRGSNISRLQIFLYRYRPRVDMSDGMLLIPVGTTHRIVAAMTGNYPWAALHEYLPAQLLWRNSSDSHQHCRSLDAVYSLGTGLGQCLTTRAMCKVHEKHLYCHWSWLRVASSEAPDCTQDAEILTRTALIWVVIGFMVKQDP